jgi:nitrate reductase gamma subunit
VNRTLLIVHYSGIIIGLILLASSYLSKQAVNRLSLWVEQGLLLLLTAACAFGQFVIGAQLQSLRGQIGRPIDEVTMDDPLRVAFNDLHGYSVTILSVAMIAALISFFLLIRRAAMRNSTTKEAEIVA